MESPLPVSAFVSSSVYQVIRGIAAEAAAQSDPDSSLRLLRAGLIRLGFKRAGVFVVDPAEPNLLRGVWGTDWDGSEIDAHDVVARPEPGDPRLLILQGARVACDRLVPPPPSGGAHHTWNVTETGPPNHALVALRADGELLGMMAVDMLPTAETIGDDDVAVLELLADQVAVAVARGRAVAALRAANAALQTELEERRRIEEARRRGEEQLRVAQRMDAMGKLASGIAHDFNNLLTVINGYAEVLQTRHAADRSVNETAGRILDAGRKAAALVSQLLAFTRQQVASPRQTNLNALLREFGPIVERMVGEDVAFELQLDPALGTILVDVAQIQQVLINLATNSREAMPRGGKLAIETANADLDETYARLHPDAVPGRYVRLAVSDTGRGIDPAIRDRIFDPFFTTKDEKRVGRGAGLSLAAVYGIVKQCGGSIAVYSEPGYGTTFSLYFPRTDVLAAPAPTAEPSLPAPGTETILVVEDEPQLRRLAVSLLTARGYHVLEAESGTKALAVADAWRAPIDLVLTDVVMPGLSGPQVAEKLARRQPKLKALYMSGFSEDIVVSHGLQTSDLNFLQKPFTPSALANKVRLALTASV
jgi:signal transduction histidine kinase/ActR/RegA family two-component response regulator